MYTDTSTRAALRQPYTEPAIRRPPSFLALEKPLKAMLRGASSLGPPSFQALQMAHPRSPSSLGPARETPCEEGGAKGMSREQSVEEKETLEDQARRAERVAARRAADSRSEGSRDQSPGWRGCGDLPILGGFRTSKEGVGLEGEPPTFLILTRRAGRKGSQGMGVNNISFDNVLC